MHKKNGVHPKRTKKELMLLHMQRAVLKWRLAPSSFRLLILVMVVFVLSLFLLCWGAGGLDERPGSKVLQGTAWLGAEAAFAAHGKYYTIVINTYKRNDLLQESVSHYSQCRMLDAIRVVWSEKDRPPEELLASTAREVQEHGIVGEHRVELRFDIHEQNSLNNRFRPLDGLRTEAVFSVDDDVLVPCPLLEFAFEVWLSAPDAMVGFVPRMHWPDKLEERVARVKYTYGGWISVWWSGRYSMILTKAAFLHHKYFEMYTASIPPPMLAYVHEARNCEDLAMSFLVANATRAAPIWVKGRFAEQGAFGISSASGHIARRSKCLNDFVDIFGRMPLVEGHMKAVRASEQLLW